MQDRIARLKRELCCKREELAVLLDVSPSCLSSYLRGSARWPDRVILRIAICESRLGLDPVQRDVITLSSLRPHLESIARDTVAGVDRLRRRERAKLRAEVEALHQMEKIR